MKRVTKGISCLIVISLFSIFNVFDSVSAASFTTCSSFNIKYPNGVARSRSDANKQKIKPKVSASIYRAHKNLDKDKDGTVCEVKKVIVSPTESLLSQSTVIFSTEVVPFDGTVTGTNLGPIGSSSFPPERNFDGKPLCGLQNVKSLGFNYVREPVAPCNQTDFVMLKYSGFIPKTNRGIQSVVIQASHDDGVFLSIDGQTVLDKWRDCVCSSSVTIPNFNLNVDHSFEVWYYERSGEAYLNLNWKSATSTSNTRFGSGISPAPVAPVVPPSSTLITKPSTSTTVCVPDNFALTVLIHDTGKWASDYVGIRERAWLWGGDTTKFDAMAGIRRQNQSVANNARQALNECKRISYRFDDYEKVYSVINAGGSYRSDAWLITS